ncbi:transposase [Endozoicomonas sp. SCSIO W0465]|uniref:transposase n=1 Tax=Endozoicomonas sp. SCSIO W0465 TaxID=2918516 RepID=UPI0020764C1A|nr:transposase [Endozoicomonas sp. SCSIO W0465]USE39450.1 transposase [Endozoicomonas sp. SCSIO W0465]
MIIPKPEKIEIEFTDAKLTGMAGALFIARLARRFKLPEQLSTHIQLKKRNRGCDDKDSLLGLIYNFCAGNGHLSDMDILQKDRPTVSLLGLEDVRGSRRMGEYLSRFKADSVKALYGVIRDLCRQVAPDVIEHVVKEKSYLPIFLDGTEIEVDGHLFQEAKVGYSGSRQYWLHSIFIGHLWASARLNPGASDVCYGWQEQLENDVVPLVSDDIPVWARMDNAYYRKQVVEWFEARPWDFSISVTNDNYCRPVLDCIEGLPKSAWTPIRSDNTEEAILSYHQPAGWNRQQTYVVTRRWHDGKQWLAVPRYSVILVSRSDLPLAELVRRHREKQGQENAQKGPLIDLDLHHPPCRSFHANQAFYACGQMAQILLRALQYKALPEKERRHGIRPLIRKVIRSVGRFLG